MSRGTPDGDHTSAAATKRHPPNKWWLAVFPFVVPLAALAETAATRVVTLLLGLVAAALLYLAVGNRGFLRGLLLCLTVLIGAGALAVVFTSGPDAQGDPPSQGPKTNDPKTSSPFVSDPPKTLTPSPSATATKSTPESTPSPLPYRDIKGPDAPTRLVKLRSTVDVFPATPLTIGYSNDYTTSARITLTSEADSCDASLGVGQRGVLLGSSDVGRDDRAVWFRVTLLNIGRQEIRLRAERVTSVYRPPGGVYPCGPL